VSPSLVSRAITALVLSIILFAPGRDARSQDPLEGSSSGSRTSLSAGSTESPKRPVVRTATVVRTVTITKVVRVTPTTGTLAVAAEPNATILVEPVSGGEGQEGTIPPDERIFIFNDLKPGRYRVAAELDGYQPAEKQVLVVSNKPSPVTLNLRPITYNVTINTNVASGEVRYVTKGEPPRFAQIQSGKAVLPNLRAGKYDLDIRPGEVGYQTLLASMTLPGKTSFDVELKKLLSTKSLFPAWTSLDDWDAPAEWHVASRKLEVKGRGIAIPRDESYRYYADFQLISDVNMLNGVAASFVVHYVDTKNYYLIQLTGAKADETYVLRGFAVVNGVSQRLGTIPIEGFAETMKPNQFFKVSIKMAGNNISVSIPDNQGEFLPLGVLTDPNKNFPIGAIGIAARDNEQNEIGRFIVCTPECPKE
jgi:hypothetical protein